MRVSSQQIKKKMLGQAMTEYLLMSFAMVLVCLFMFEAFMYAYMVYTKAFYLLLVLPIP